MRAMTKQKKPSQIESADRLELLAIRNRLRLTQAGMAAAMSVSTSLLEKYERGTRRLPADRMARIRELDVAAKPLASEHEAHVASHSVEQHGQLRYDRTMSTIGTVFAGAAFICFVGAFFPELMPAPLLTGLSAISVSLLSPVMGLEVWRRICMGYPTRKWRSQVQPD